jgi:hypothetical protein
VTFGNNFVRITTLKPILLRDSDDKGTANAPAGTAVTLTVCHSDKGELEEEDGGFITSTITERIKVSKEMRASTIKDCKSYPFEFESEP